MDSEARINDLARRLDSALSRIRELEARLPAQGLRVSAKDGPTKIVRLDQSGQTLEAD